MAEILIVEDDMFILELTEMMIQGWGHRTLSAGGVDEALALLRSSQDIDVLFTDIYLKTVVLGGIEIANEAIRLRPNLRVLYTTGNSSTEKMKALFIRGAQFLRKPYSPNQLQGCLAAMVAA